MHTLSSMCVAPMNGPSWRLLGLLRGCRGPFSVLVHGGDPSRQDLGRLTGPDQLFHRDTFVQCVQAVHSSSSSVDGCCAFLNSFSICEWRLIIGSTALRLMQQPALTSLGAVALGPQQLGRYWFEFRFAGQWG
ncbi:hypothetical protein M514_15874 [Trichuris suis]|uniref:Uncharacterized protein n=1 Tax=Trichuris suis TaxID=68888 RepID=A0A085NQL8_9BILA|nr:hypothetical protein M514_15874 [Trichuris suis]